MRNNEGFRTFPYCFGTFLNDFKLGANETGIFSYCKDIFSYCEGKIFEESRKIPANPQKKFKFLKSVVIR